MKNSFTLNFLLFTGFLVFGYTVSARFNPSPNGSQLGGANPIVTSSNGAIQTLNNGQRSMLLIWVDSVETSKPSLISLWLVSYLPSQSTVQFLPIYPVGNKDISDWQNSLARSFTVERLFNLNDKNIKIVPGEKFTKFLEDSNYWWSGYFIFDQAQIDRIQELVSNQVPGKIANDKPIIQNDLDVYLAHGNTFSMTFSAFQTICGNLSDFSATSEYSQVIAKVSSHFFTNLDDFQILQEWDDLLANGSVLKCEFPTLQEPMLNR